MKYRAKYVIWGKKELLALASSSDIFALFAEPILINSHEGGCKDLWTNEDYLNRAKIFYLMQIYDEYSHTNELSNFFPKTGISIDFFNQYWEILSIEDEESIPDFGNKFTGLGKIVRNNIAPTNNEKIENWLNETFDF